MKKKIENKRPISAKALFSATMEVLVKNKHITKEQLETALNNGLEDTLLKKLYEKDLLNIKL